MDKVLFVINGNEVYVGDYYKQELKPIKFHDKDYWEVYDGFDWRELIEYMNYPLHYKRFKDSGVVVLYDKPARYEMLTTEKECFGEAEMVQTGYLSEHLYAYCESQEHFGETLEYLLNFEGAYYTGGIRDAGWKIRKCTTEEVQDLDEEVFEKAHKVSVMTLCKFILDTDAPLQAFDDRWLVLSPVTMSGAVVGEGKEQFLETYFKLDMTSVRSDGALKAGDTLFQYNQQVRTFFGRKKHQLLEKRSAQAGQFFAEQLLHDMKEDLCIPKGALLGVVGHAEDTPATIQDWLRKIGY